MEHYIVSARKYRPSTFDTVVGQHALTATLKNAIASDKLAHAYLFCGGRGVGKTSCARIFAKTINCTCRTNEGEACNQCDSCRQFNEGRSLNIIELDAASHNGVDDIKDLIEQVMVPPTTGRYRVFIIDEVHMLTSAAFNAFLKTLEEPPAHAIFILATTEKHKILPTILSRCQIYDFNRIGIPDMVSHMAKVAANEGISAEPAALTVIARKADGAMRDALSIFDQVAACSSGNITYQATIENLNVLDRAVYDRLMDAFVKNDVATALLIYKEIRDKGFDSQFFINGLGLYLRDIMVSASPKTAILVEAPEDERQRLAERAAGLHPTFLYKAMELCNDADFNFRQATNKQFLIELTLIRLCQLLSPSSENNGDDEGRKQPLLAVTPVAGANNLPPVSAQPHVAAAQKPMQTHAPAVAASQVAPKFSTKSVAAYSVGGLSLSNANKPQVKQQADTPVKSDAPARTKQFTEADFLDAWQACASAGVADVLVSSVIATYRPVRAQNGSYSLTVTAEMQYSSVLREKPKILTYLRNKLENDSVDFELILNIDVQNPKYWPEKRILEYMLKKHPQLDEMIKKYKMRLG